MNTSPPENLADVWLAGLRWVEGCFMQMERLNTAVGEMTAAVADTRFRTAIAQLPEDQAEQWRNSSDPPARILTHAIMMQVQTETDLLLVAANNVLRAVKTLPDDFRPSDEHLEEIGALLRNISEHFDEATGRSKRKLAEKFPDVNPGEIAYAKRWLTIGGMTDKGLDTIRLTGWLMDEVEPAFRNALEAEGVPVPKYYGESIFSDEDDPDDEWPPFRLRYSWHIPQIELEDWPAAYRTPEETDISTLIEMLRDDDGCTR